AFSDTGRKQCLLMFSGFLILRYKTTPSSIFFTPTRNSPAIGSLRISWKMPIYSERRSKSSTDLSRTSSRQCGLTGGRCGDACTTKGRKDDEGRIPRGARAKSHVHAARVG